MSDKRAKELEVLLRECKDLVYAAGWARTHLEDAPDINPSNYDHDQVCELNSQVIEAWQLLDPFDIRDILERIDAALSDGGEHE